MCQVGREHPQQAAPGQRRKSSPSKGWSAAAYMTTRTPPHDGKPEPSDVKTALEWTRSRGERPRIFIVLPRLLSVTVSYGRRSRRYECGKRRASMLLPGDDLDLRPQVVQLDD